MLKVRIIPTILYKDFGIVKGIGFDSWRRVGSILPAVKVYNTRQVDELIIVDITASKQNRGPDFELIDEIADDCFVPLTVGGGVRSVDDIIMLLKAGADKVAINSAAYSNPSLITEGAKKFGSQCIVSSIDFKKMSSNKYSCFSHSGTIDLGINPVDWAIEMENRGAGEILLTSINKDGTMEGYDLELTEMVTSALKIPVIISGGCGSYAHMLDAIRISNANAIAAASIFTFTEQTPMAAKLFLAEKGILTRK